ncbi:hypothetical protein [Marinimicrobium sp. ABcell2]|uniref:hypothetical protein n=1 Tax=Marinimicrobium sp. ABcell2 TaxID=3069751 RepID=UPI0027B43E1E|nr:hypothetical protein [Marinimicrobium sp. ABcell2]MDQ2077471.1 hypothetical protein [Marinimicrobium sp. ABcell2]
MNELIQFPKARELAAGSRVEEYIYHAIDRFEELKKFKLFRNDTEWEDESWYYQANGGASIALCKSDKERDAPELISSLKTYLTYYIFDRRLKGSLPTISNHAYGFRVIIQRTGIKTLNDLNQDVYNAFLSSMDHIATRSQAGAITSANAVIRWLQERDLLTTLIDLARPPSLSQLPAIREKMPSRDLVQAILDAKWKVAETENDSMFWEYDMISVLAQSLQYGLGLRIGEVLRLPSDPIKYADGKMYFVAWTEKGTAPLARYVPTEWREVFEHTISEIKRITEPYRKRAKELEDFGRLSEVEKRLKDFHDEKQRDKERKLAKLEELLTEKRRQAEVDWSTNMRDVIDPDRYYSVSETRDLMPIQVTSDSYANRLAKRCFESAGLTFQEDPTDTSRWTRYRIKGSAIQDCITQHIAFRSTNLIDLEMLEIIHERKFTWESKENSELSKRLIKGSSGGSFRTFTMRGATNFNKRGCNRATLTKKSAIEIIELTCGGGFDTSKWIDIPTFARMFDDDFYTAGSLAIMAGPNNRGRIPEGLVITDRKVDYWSKTSKDRSGIWRYMKCRGYLIEQESIHNFILARFKRINLNIEQEIHSEPLDLDESRNAELAVVIDSESFRIKQKVSDYLMLAGLKNNNGGQKLIPSIISYSSIHYSFKGGGRSNIDGLFQRYDVSNDVSLTKEFQTHKGRHWKTTSLFRSGASGEVVNLWMGRDPSQGSQYDHNTDHDRAKKIKEAMKNDSHRFVGHIASKLRQLEEHDAQEDLIDDYLDSEIHVVQHSPTGMCTRELAIKPCDITMRCLNGKDGKGCKNFMFDLADIGQVERLTAWLDQEQREVTRLESLREKGYAGAQMHLDAKVPALKNAKIVLQAHKVKSEMLETEIRPFRIDGSDPSDCPFECGE